VASEQQAASQVADDEDVTQYGRAGKRFDDAAFRDRPRIVDAGGVSVLRGRQSIATTVRLVRKAPPQPGDSVRHASVGVLRAAGFAVSATPSRRNPLHVTVSCPLPCDDETARTFDVCFDPPRWHEETR
jgi:hypothetical protein